MLEEKERENREIIEERERDERDERERWERWERDERDEREREIDLPKCSILLGQGLGEEEALGEQPGAGRDQQKAGRDQLVMVGHHVKHNSV